MNDDLSTIMLRRLGLPTHGRCPVCSGPVTGGTRRVGRTSANGPIEPTITTVAPCGDVLVFETGRMTPDTTRRRVHSQDHKEKK